MAHIIDAIVLKNNYDSKEAEKYDLRGVPLDFGLTMFFIDDDFINYWQNKLNIAGFLETNCPYPNARVIYEFMKRISRSDPIQYAVVSTAYVGGIGEQYANVYKNDENVDISIKTISDALRFLGVLKESHYDEFDALGLGRFRSNPDYLNKYHRLLQNLKEKSKG